MASEKVAKKIREPNSGLTKPDAILVRIIPRFIDFCNIDQFKETRGVNMEAATIFGYDQRRRFTKSTWLNSEDRSESEDKFFGTLELSNK